MRRKDREVTEQSKILEIIEKCECCRLGFYDGKEVYIVPLNFGYEYKNDRLTLYFHGAKEGRKIDLIKIVDSVGFEMDTNYKLNEADIACEHSANYTSIIGNGEISIINDISDKENALQRLMLKTTHKSDWTFSKEMINSVCVFKVEVTKMSCKANF